MSRLRTADWSGDMSFDHRRSRAKLMGEYLRRAAWWAHELDATGDWPFFDIAGRLTPDVSPPAHLVSELDELIATAIKIGVVAAACRDALGWAAVLDAGVPFPSFLDDPFEPLLFMFQRGGGFTTEHGFIDLGGASVRRRTWRDHLTGQPVVVVTESALDELDEGRPPS